MEGHGCLVSRVLIEDPIRCALCTMLVYKPWMCIMCARNQCTLVVSSLAVHWAGFENLACAHTNCALPAWVRPSILQGLLSVDYPAMPTVVPMCCPGTTGGLSWHGPWSPALGFWHTRFLLIHLCPQRSIGVTFSQAHHSPPMFALSPGNYYHRINACHTLDLPWPLLCCWYSKTSLGFMRIIPSWSIVGNSSLMRLRSPTFFLSNETWNT